MIDISTLDVSGFKGAIYGAREPMKGRDKSDSGVWDTDSDGNPIFTIGAKDLELCQKLIRAGGDDEAKFMRMIHVQAIVDAPLYWWKEYDTYKVATVANSESTMHTIHKSEIDLDDFSCDYLNEQPIRVTWQKQDYIDASHDCLYDVVGVLNTLREKYLNAIEAKDPDAKQIWYQIIQLLPTSYMQERVIDLNYQTLRRIYFARRNHKLDEWHEFCAWIEDLPYGPELITYDPDSGRDRRRAARDVYLEKASNLICNMTERGATYDEIATVVKYTMEMIDSIKTGNSQYLLWDSYNIKYFEEKYGGSDVKNTSP